MELEWLDENRKESPGGPPVSPRIRGFKGALSRTWRWALRLWERLGPPQQDPAQGEPMRSVRRALAQGDQGLYQEDEIDLYALYLVVRRRLRFLLTFVVGAAFVTGFTSFFILPKVYKAEATIVPLESQESGLLSALSALGGVAGIPLPQKQTSAQTLVAVLESRSVAESVIENTGLMKEFFKSRWDHYKGRWKDPDDVPPMEDAVSLLKDMVSVTQETRSGLITIEVYYTDPVLASVIANSFLEELDKFINKNALSMAKRQRIFLEGQVETTKRELAQAEENLKGFQEEKRLVAMDTQAQAAIKGLAELKAMITAKEVELDVLRTYATAQNPRVQILESELKELRKQLQKMEAEESKKGGSELSLASAPDLGLTYVRLQREVMYRAKVLELLYQQYEMAKIQEAKEDVRFQVIDLAVPPVRKAKPKVALNIVLSALLALMLGVFWIFTANYLQRIKAKRSAGPQPQPEEGTWVQTPVTAAEAIESTGKSIPSGVSSRKRKAAAQAEG